MCVFEIVVFAVVTPACVRFHAGADAHAGLRDSWYFCARALPSCGSWLAFRRKLPDCESAMCWPARVPC